MQDGQAMQPTSPLKEINVYLLGFVTVVTKAISSPPGTVGDCKKERKTPDII